MWRGIVIKWLDITRTASLIAFNVFSHQDLEKMLTNGLDGV